MATPLAVAAIAAGLAYLLRPQTVDVPNVSPGLDVTFPDAGGDADAAPAVVGAYDPTAAFLYAIGCAEVGQRAMDSGEAYRTYYGGSKFSSFADHPALTGEKPGVPLSDATCRAAGFSPGCVSTAAGAFQINLPTWQDVRTWGPYLSDFSPESQREAARRLLEHDGVLPFLLAGDFAGAIAAASRRWASLPGSNSGQGRRSLAFVLDRIEEGMHAQG